MKHEFPLTPKNPGSRIIDGDADNLTVMIVAHHMQLSTAHMVVIGRPVPGASILSVPCRSCDDALEGRGKKVSCI